MATKDTRRAALSKYQARALSEYEHILEVTGLNPERVLEFAEDQPEAIAPKVNNRSGRPE